MLNLNFDDDEDANIGNKIQIPRIVWCNKFLYSKAWDNNFNLYTNSLLFLESNNIMNFLMKYMITHLHYNS